MIQENRFSYLLITLTIIIIGLFSRKIAFIPYFVGDLLYAAMVYFGIRFLFILQKKSSTAVISLITCYCIELLQLYDTTWIIALRNTLFGRYVLGQGFLWSDIVAYSFGVVMAYYIESIALEKKY